MVEVLIVGAGPAGSVAAVLLARAGVRVLLVDRARFPRHKICGDTINPGALALLRRLDLGELGVLDAGAVQIGGMVVTDDRGVQIRAPYPEGQTGRSIARREFDAALLAAAVAAGAHVEEAVTVRGALLSDIGGVRAVRGVVIAGRNGTRLRVPASMTVAADGRHSTLAFALGLARHPVRPRRWAVAGYFRDVEGMTSFGEMHLRRNHYIGVAPLPGGIVNACLVTSDRTGFRNPRELLTSRLSSDVLLRDRFSRAVEIGPVCSVGPMAVTATAAGMPGLLLAGDAAGFIDPMTGDGLRFAIRGAELAAGAALDMLERGTTASHVRLRRLRTSEFAGKWMFNRALRTMAGSAGLTRVVATLAQTKPSFLNRMVSIAGDVPTTSWTSGR